MGAFDDGAFDTAAFDPDAFEFDAGGGYTPGAPVDSDDRRRRRIVRIRIRRG